MKTLHTSLRTATVRKVSENFIQFFTVYYRLKKRV